jgi:25S rRNA (uracil2634-N3)-methyltransferase
MAIGDFSFALSLRKFHAVRRITATCFDSENKLGEKYPQAIENIASLFQISPSPILQTKESDDEFDDNDYDDGWQNLEDGGNDQRETDEKSKVTVAVYYSIDATKLHKQQRALKAQKFDRIAFMFPHVGGLTKDQDRQIHYNQELLQGYFKSARELLVPKTGTILVTLFEGMPYELWNIKALAKDAGLVTHRSFRFDASEYPGYKHVRTLGNIKGGGGGAWKVEDRLARVYVFGLEGVPPTQKKRMRHDGSDEE